MIERRRPAEEQAEWQQQHAGQNAYRLVGAAPAVVLDQPLRDRRPGRAADVVAARADRDRDAAPALEPVRDVGEQRGEGRRAAEHADQQSLRQRELPGAAGVGREREAGELREGAEDERRQHADAIDHAPDNEAAEREAEHRPGVREGGIGARDAELLLQRRQHDDDGIHARAADRHQQRRSRQPQPGIGRFDRRDRRYRASVHRGKIRGEKKGGHYTGSGWRRIRRRARSRVSLLPFPGCTAPSRSPGAA